MLRSARLSGRSDEAPLAPRSAPRSYAPADIRLVALAAQGDHPAFEQLYIERVHPIGRYVGALLSDREAVEDVVAQTFLLAWRDLPRLRDHERFDAWLFRIARNQAVSAGRRRPREAAVPLGPEHEHADPEITPPGALEREADRREIHRALRQLPDDQRDVLVLRFMSELSHREVARHLDKTEQATRALQYRALASLRRLLGQRI